MVQHLKHFSGHDCSVNCLTGSRIYVICYVEEVNVSFLCATFGCCVQVYVGWVGGVIALRLEDVCLLVTGRGV